MAGGDSYKTTTRSGLGTSATTITPTNGNASSGETAKKKRHQSDRLERVKRRTCAIIIFGDVIMICALIVQIVSLNKGLHTALTSKTISTSNFLRYQFQEHIDADAIGAMSYANNSSTSKACLCLATPPDQQAINEMRQRLQNEQQNREIEFMLIVDPNGLVVSGPLNTDQGQIFNPSGFVEFYHKRFAETGEQMSGAILIDVDVFRTMNAPEYGDDDEFGHDLPSYERAEPTLTQLTLTPLTCGLSTAQGYIITGHGITPRNYKDFWTAPRESGGGFSAIGSRQSQSREWSTQYSYLYPGTDQQDPRFPLVQDVFGSSVLDDALLAVSGSPIAGDVTIDGVDYKFAAAACPRLRLGDRPILDSPIPDASVYILGIHQTAIRQTTWTAIAWHVPFGVFVVFLGCISLQQTYFRFVNPMRSLIDSVKKKQIKEFNEIVRRMKNNKTFLLGSLAKAFLIQGILLGLVFVNRHLLTSSVSEFSTATSEGRFMHNVVSTKSDQIQFYLDGFTSFDWVIQAMKHRQFNEEINHELNVIAERFHVEFVCFLDKSSTVTASTAPSSVGWSFPSVAISEAMMNSTGTSLTTTDLWNQRMFARFANLTAERAHHDREIPVVIRLVASTITDIQEVNGSLITGDVVGSVVVGDMVNGNIDVWDSSLASLDEGFFGVYVWDDAKRDMALLTSVLKTGDGVKYGVDIDPSSRDVVQTGIISAYNREGIYTEPDTLIDGEYYTISVAPLVSAEDINANAWVLNAYIVRGVSQSEWTALLNEQLFLQITVMVIEVLTSFFTVFLSYLPMRKFLASLERAFSIPSVSNKARIKQESTAAAMIQLMAGDHPTAIGGEATTVPGGGISSITGSNRK